MGFLCSLAALKAQSQTLTTRGERIRKPTWYTNVSRIKRKISDKLGKRASEQYIIRRGADGLYRIDAQKARPC